MKILKTIAPKATILFLLIVGLLSSCSSDDDTHDAPAQSDVFLTAEIDGVEYSRDFVTVSAFPDETDTFIISAVGETSSIGFTLESPISTGIFTSSVGGETVLFYQETNPFNVWGAGEDVGSGTITITANNATYLEGTFSFTGINPADNTTKVVSQGAFKAQKL